MDLLTVLMREFGHVLGNPDLDPEQRHGTWYATRCADLTALEQPLHAVSQHLSKSTFLNPKCYDFKFNG